MHLQFCSEKNFTKYQEMNEKIPCNFVDNCIMGALLSEINYITLVYQYFKSHYK